MAKKFKRVTYEKEIDDHYVVVLNPWTNGSQKPRLKEQIDFIGAWLRIAFRKPSEKNIVKTIYTLDTRDEVIAQISSEIDVEIGLGAHKWGEFMGQEHLDRIKRQTNGRVDLSDQISYIFIYNWAVHGDPAERQWREWFPRQDDIPPDIMIKMNYPDPWWTEVPPIDARLKNLLLPMPPRPEMNRTSTSALTPSSRSLNLKTNSVSSRSNTEAQETKSIIGELQHHINGDRSRESTTTFTPYHPPAHMHAQSLQPQPDNQIEDIKPSLKSGKIDKLDPFEEDKVARAALTPLAVKVEVPKVQAETEDTKPNVSSEDYQPSSALSDSLAALQTVEVPPEIDEQKPIVKKEEYNPSKSLQDAFNQYSAASMSNIDEKRKTKRAYEGGHDLEETSTSKSSVKRVKMEAEANIG